MHKLTGEQCKILYLKDDKNLALFGTAGSGKSLIAIYKAIYLSIKETNKKIAVICFNKPVVDKLKADYKSICCELGISESDNVIISTYHTFINDKLKEISYPNVNKFVKDKNKKAYIQKAIKMLKNQYPNSKILRRDISFFEEEISWLQGMHITSEEMYQEAERIGRGRKNPVNRGEDRTIIYRVFNGYRYYREGNNEFYDYDDSSWRVLENKNLILEEHKLDYLIIDEFQDMDKAKIQSLTLFVKEQGAVILLGDYAQQILGTRVSFKQLGISNISKSSFVKNYRNTIQISKLSNVLIERGFINEDEDEKINRLSSVRSGTVPILLKYSPNDIKTVIYQFFHNKQGSNGLIIMNKTKYRQISDIIRGLKDIINPICLYTINQVKGLEFDNVLILDTDDIIFLEDRENFINNENSEIAKQLYVAITRATTNLCIAYTECDLTYYLDEQLVERKGV